MLLSKKAMEEIYNVATVIYDIRGTQSRNELTLHKDLLDELPNAGAIIHKLSEQYGVIYLVTTPYDEEQGDAHIYRGMTTEEIAVKQGLEPTDRLVIEDINDTILSYALIVESNFEEFYHTLQQALLSNVALSDNDLTIQPKDRIAELSFTSISVPTVKIHDKTYHYPSMRDSSMAFKIISYCLENYSDQEVGIQTLLQDMHESAGLKNINEAIRKSPLFSQGGSLDVFVSSSAKAITVKQKVTLTLKGVLHVKKDSLEYEQFMQKFREEYSA